MVGGSLRVLPASSTTKTGRHDIAEILLKVALNTKNQSKSINHKIIKCMQIQWNFMINMFIWRQQSCFQWRDFPSFYDVIKMYFW